MLYYLRFWLTYHFPHTAVLDSPYTGDAFFDFVVTWIEFGPWFACLFVTYLYRGKQSISCKFASLISAEPIVARRSPHVATASRIRRELARK